MREATTMLIETNVKNHIGTITLNDRKSLNSLSSSLIQELLDALEDFRNKGILAVILRALPSTKTWSAGHNVGELPKHARDPLTHNDPLRVVVRKIQEYPAPVLAMVEGGVCEFAMACDMVIAAENATFGLTPAKSRRAVQPRRYSEHVGFGTVGGCERNAFSSGTDQRAKGVRSWMQTMSCQSSNWKPGHSS
jgi:1,4-dihydroxy-2-naphthoyl-CoA synthase